MDGIGVYTWQDGRQYRGEYKDDKKHGYGIYTWSDGRTYSGHWCRGKQHGLGTYDVPGQPTKFGLWEEGKRIEWFENDQYGKITNGQLDYKMYFRKTESGFNVDQFATFDVPNKFHERVQRVIEKFRRETPTPTPQGQPQQQYQRQGAQPTPGGLKTAGM